MYENFYVGPPTYFVVKEGYPMSDATTQNRICSSIGCSPDSLTEQIFAATRVRDKSRIATSAMSWIDDYIDWLASSSCCVTDSKGNFCTHNDTFSKSDCDRPCMTGYRPDPETFRKFIGNFLKSNPVDYCPKAGHAAYGQAVKVS